MTLTLTHNPNPSKLSDLSTLSGLALGSIQVIPSIGNNFVFLIGLFNTLSLGSIEVSSSLLLICSLGKTGYARCAPLSETSLGCHIPSGRVLLRLFAHQAPTVQP